MASAGTIWTEIDVNGEKLVMGLRKAGASGSSYVKKTEAEFKGMSKAIEDQMKRIGAAVGAYFSVNAIKNFATSSIKAFAEQEESIHRLNLALESTGKYTDAAAAHQQQLAVSIAETTKYTKEQVRSIETYLATMTNLKPGKGLDDATKGVLGLSSVLTDKDPQQIAVAVGKAMMGNMMGLQKMGVMLKDTGDPLKNQAQLLNQLLPLYEWAQRETETLTGHATMLGKAWVGLEQDFGGTLLAFADSIDVLDTLKEAILQVRKAIDRFSLQRIEDAQARLLENKALLNLGNNRGLPEAQPAYTWRGALQKLTGMETMPNKDALMQQIASDESLVARLERIRNPLKSNPLPEGFKNIFDPKMKDTGDAAGKAKLQAEQYASIMASIGGKWLESTQGVDAHAVALQKVDTMCDKYAFDLQKAGINGENLRVAMEAIESLRTFEKQNIELKAAEEATQKYDDLMQSIGGQWLEATQGTNAYQLALQKINNVYDDQIKKIQEIKDLTSEQRKNLLDAAKATRDAQTDKTNKDNSNEALGGMWDAIGGAAGSIGNAFESQRGGVFSGLAKLSQTLPKKFDEYKKITANMVDPNTGKMSGMGTVSMFSSAISAVADAYTAGQASGNKTMGAVQGGLSVGVAGAGVGFMLGGPMGAAIGAVVGAIVGAVAGFLGGGGSGKKPPSKEELEAGKMKDEEIQLGMRGFLQPMYSKGEMKKENALFKGYVDAMKNIDKQLSDAIANGLKEGLKQPTAQAAIDEFNKNFSAGFSNIFIATASQSLDKIMKIMVAPMTQIVEDAVFMIERKAQAALKPAYVFILETYKSINNAVGALFDMLNAGLKSLSAAIPGLGEALGGGVYAVLMMLIPIIVSVFSELLAALAKVAEKIFEPVLRSIFQLTKAFEKLFDVRPTWVEEAERAGIVLSDALGSDAVKKMEDAWGKIKDIISDALKAAFESGNADTAYQNFCRKFKEGIYKFMVEGLIQALAAGAIILPALAPFITQYVALIAKAMTGGKIDPAELRLIFKGITDNITNALGDSEGIIKDLFGVVDDFKHDLLDDPGATTPNDPGPPAEVEAAKTGWDAIWARLKTAWDDLGIWINNILVSVDAVFLSFKWGLGGFLNAVLKFILDVFGLHTGDTPDEPVWYTFIKDTVHLLFGWIEDLWNIMTGNPLTANHDPEWVLWIKQSLHYLFGWIEDAWNWFWGIKTPPDTTFAGMKPQWAVDFEKFFSWLWQGLVGIWNWVFPPPEGDPAFKSAIMACVTAIGDALKTAWNFITAPFKTIFDAITAVMQWIAGACNRAMNDIDAFLRSLGMHPAAHQEVAYRASYATGTNYVPQTGLYQLHQGEAVVPAGKTQGAGGGVTIHIAQVVIREEIDIKRAARELGWHIEQQLQGA